MGGQSRVDPLVEQLGDPLGHLPRQLEISKIAQRIRTVRVADHQTALPFVAGQVEGCPSQPVTAFRWHEHRQAADAVGVITIVGVLDRNEGQVVGVLDAGDPGHRDPQSKVLGVILFGPDLEHLGEGSVADVDNGLVQRGRRGLGRRCAHGVEPTGRASVRRSGPR